MAIITIPDYLSDKIFDERECAFVRRELEFVLAESEAPCCDSGATILLSSSFMKCAEIKNM